MSSRNSRSGSKADLVVSRLHRKDQETRKVVLIKGRTFAGIFSLQKGVRMEITVGFNMSRRTLAIVRKKSTRKKIKTKRKYMRTVNLVKTVIKKTVD